MLAAASLLPLSAPTPSCECCAATRDALLGYCEEQRPMGDLGLDAFRCEDYFGNLATHGDTSSRPTAKDACLDECNERLAAARARDCGLTCHKLEIDCPCAAPPPPPPPVVAAACAKLPCPCEPVAEECCEATLGALQKFCHSFEPPSGWAPACKSADATHYDGGAYVAPWEFQALYERYAPAQCGREGALVKRVVQHFARAVSPSICEAVLSGRCPARFCQNTCGGDAPPAPPSHPVTVLASKAPCDTGIPDPLPNGSHPVV